MGIHLVAAGGYRSHSAAGEGEVAAATDPPMRPVEGNDILFSSKPNCN